MSWLAWWERPYFVHMFTQLVNWCLFTKFRNKWQVTHRSKTRGKSSIPCFVMRGLTRVLFQSSGKYPIWRDLLTKSVNMGRRDSRHYFKSHVESLLHCLFGECLISFWTSSSDRGWKKRNISSYFIGTLEIVMKFGIMSIQFCSNFLNFYYKKSSNASARSFNQSQSRVIALVVMVLSWILRFRKSSFDFQHIPELFQNITLSLPHLWRICTCCALIWIFLYVWHFMGSLLCCNPRRSVSLRSRLRPLISSLYQLRYCRLHFTVCILLQGMIIYDCARRGVVLSWQCLHVRWIFTTSWLSHCVEAWLLDITLQFLVVRVVFSVIKFASFFYHGFQNFTKSHIWWYILAFDNANGYKICWCDLNVAIIRGEIRIDILTGYILQY